jgi:mannose-6-phosphate isomerase-like protein (cupin superfamily)
MVEPIALRSEEAPLVEWRPGVRTRLHSSEAAEPGSLCVIEQWCDPGLGAPTHTHFEVEEVIAIVEGSAEVWVEDSTSTLSAGDSVLLPPHSQHGFRNVGESTLHTFAIFGAARPPVCYADEPGTILEVGGRRPAQRDPHRAVRAQQGEES